MYAFPLKQLFSKFFSAYGVNIREMHKITYVLKKMLRFLPAKGCSPAPSSRSKSTPSQPKRDLQVDT